jgi:hypothetical protein
MSASLGSGVFSSISTTVLYIFAWLTVFFIKAPPSILILPQKYEYFNSFFQRVKKYLFLAKKYEKTKKNLCRIPKKQE